MNIKVSKNLIELSRIFSKIAPLYIVGGYVRNAILNNYETDVDIASSLSMEQILSILSGTQYLVKIKSAKMGTLTISTGEEVYEHTTFRTDNYSLDGSHSPLNVFFNATINEDASRRDFKCNTIYYDILHKKIIDFYGGLNDINNKTFSCIETPEKVFSGDGLRLLRLVRQSSELNFSIENNTFISAKNFAKNLSKIVGERKSRELDLILNSDIRYTNLSNQNSVINGLNNLTKLDLWKYLFNNKNYTYDFDYENFYSLKCKNELRLEAFITEIYFHINAQNIIEPKKFCNLFLGGKGLNFSKKEQIRVLRFIESKIDIDKLVKTAYSFFIAKNYDIIDDIFEIFSYKKEIISDLKITILDMKKNNAPFTLQELKINGNDLIREYKNIDVKQIGFILNKLKFKALQNYKLNNYQSLLELAKKYI